MFARHFIDSLDFARKGLELRGEAAIAELPRLQDLLASPEGQVGFVLRGVQGKNGEPLLELALEGNCQLRCQRCLQALPHAISTVSLLIPVPESSLAAGGDLEEEDGIDRIPADAHLDVLALIEDEILLGLPLSPRHEFGVCEAAAGNAPAGEQHPFAVLRKLKNQ
ncbi:MAG TPA: YceD family protein [Gallionellaceae bacterium]|nr:YceD family protein [Gallionellaceae bacterium]